MAAAIAFLSDFGYKDHYVGVVKGVILSHAPACSIIDIAHSVPAYDISQGAYLLLASYAYFPKGTVFLAVVDPGVGGDREGVVIEAGGYVFVGPDNGIFAPVMTKEHHFRAFAIDAALCGLGDPHSTFHARDLFAPVAAWLAQGRNPETLGPPIQPDQEMPWRFSHDDRGLLGEIIYCDTFGTLITSIPNEALNGRDNGDPMPYVVEIGKRRTRLNLVETYCSVAEGTPALIRGSSGFVEVAVNMGSAAEMFGMGKGATIVIHKES